MTFTPSPMSPMSPDDLASAPTRPRHSPHGWPRDAGGELLVGGVPLRRLAERVGGTPFYAYDRSRIVARVAQLRAALPPEVELHFAVKANPMPAVLALMQGLVDGFDVASAGEMQRALDAGMAPAQISFAGPGKREAELRQAAAAGIVVNIEGLREIDLLARLGVELGVTPRVALRVNPRHELKGAAVRMGGGPKVFGVDADEAPAALARIVAAGLDFQGFHLFAGSQGLNAEAIAESQRQGLALAIELAACTGGVPIRSCNLGGGFGIPYFAGDRPLDLAPIGQALAGLVDQARAELGPQAVLQLELGRYLVGEAGIYVTRVLERKVSRGVVHLVCDGGLHQNQAAAGHFGQVIRRNHPIEPGCRAVDAAAATEVVQVAGPLCTPMDLLGDRVELPALEAGDLIVVFMAGAYGASASPQQFLGHPPVTEALV